MRIVVGPWRPCAALPGDCGAVKKLGGMAVVLRSPGEYGPHPHGPEDLCEAGERVYARALRVGGIARPEAEDAGCLFELGLLQADPTDLEWLLPARPGEVLAGLLHGIRDQTALTQERMTSVAAAAERFAALQVAELPAGGGVRAVEGKDYIQGLIDEESAKCTTEHAGIQPGGIRSEFHLSRALPLVQDLAGRGLRVRSLYTHVARHGMGLQAYLDLVGPTVEIRTLDVVPERLVMFDRSVAYVAAVPDRTVALEIRIPALVDYLYAVFECFWRTALPLDDRLSDRSEVEGITHRERVIASLLAEGLTDTEVAERLGVNVRTCRHHIAKLADVLGSSSRTQLGVRIAEAGLDTLPYVSAPGPESPTGL
ncbi:Bacterial regulatory protein, LuxR family [Streptomyces sp. YIM 130001]|uniref:helix-turn-helix transcriptional regulator n=1 Tax=Streptomyces sp. YIM 130001 TaxID=2259644 RepID=UPI000EC3C79B|nr:LuxR C-terminal-related transcriptional regulator [Streptomyces sp. YIM 130001]RII08601.1 Bacterial regulatory protein, LuxR family [Streptomyces sp. YIM 130001]